MRSSPTRRTIARLVSERVPKVAVAAVALALALAVQRVDACDADVEGLFDGLADLDLRGAGVDDEDVGALVHQAVGLLGDRPAGSGRCGQFTGSSSSSSASALGLGCSVACRGGLSARPRRSDLGGSVGLGGVRLGASRRSAALGLGGGRLGRRSAFASGVALPRCAAPRRRRRAPRRPRDSPGSVSSVKTTTSAASTSYAVSWSAGACTTCGQVGKASGRQSSSSRSSTTSDPALAPERAERPRRRPWSSAPRSRSGRRGADHRSRARSESAQRSAAGPSSSASSARSCAASGQVRRHHRQKCGARIVPWRALPVPFWRNGFAEPPRTSARVLVLWVPERRAGELRGDDLVDERHVHRTRRRSSGRAAPCRARSPVAARRSSGHRPGASLSSRVVTSPPPFTALRISTRPPRGPGTAPFTRTISRSASASMTSRLSVVTFSCTEVAGHLRALEDPGRRGAGADRARRAVVLVVAVRRALALEVVPLHAAGEALALGDRGDVDLLAGGEDRGVDLLADRVAARVVEAQLDEAPSGLDRGRREVARLGLGERRRRGARRR